MKTHTMKFVLAASVALALPLAAHAHKDGECNMNGADMSQMSAEQRQKMQTECAAKKEHEHCSMMQGADMSTMSAQDKQNMMAQCHANDAAHGRMPAMPATPATPAAPATPDASGHNGGS